jgi:hypothetical protein
MAQGMARGGAGHSGGARRVLDGALENRFVKMMPAPLAGRLVDVKPDGGKDPLPCPFTGGLRVLRPKRARQGDTPERLPSDFSRVV